MSPSADAGTIVLGTGATTVVGKNLGAPVALTNLACLSGTSAAKGGSMYGVSLTSTSTGGGPSVTLLDVLVQTAPGGDGTSGQSGVGGSPAPGAGCTSGTGAVGATGAAASSAGTFSSAGFTPASGGTGGEGAVGVEGGAGASRCADGLEGCTTLGAFCMPTNDGMTMPVCTSTTPGGCGGGGGYGGTGGGGGGSSVGLFVWNVSVTVAHSVLISGAGGAGGPGGQGGVGGTGGPPGEPAMTSFLVGCGGVPPNCIDETSEVVGETGGTGLVGGSGGTGAQGAGGSSYSVFVGGSNPPSFSNVTFEVGAAGPGSVPGVSAQLGTSP